MWAYAKNLKTRVKGIIFQRQRFIKRKPKNNKVQIVQMFAEVHYFYFKIQWLFIFTSPSIIDADICGLHILGFHTHVNCPASYFSQGDHLIYHFFTTNFSSAWFRFIQISIYRCLSTASIFSMSLCFMCWSS